MTTAGWPSCSVAQRRLDRRGLVRRCCGGGPRFSAAVIWAVVSCGRRGRVGGLGQQLQGVGGVQVLEGLQGGGEVLAQRVPQPLVVRVRSQISVLCARVTTLTASACALSPATGRSWWRVGADHVGQHVRVARVALGARDARAASGTAPPAAG